MPATSLIFDSHLRDQLRERIASFSWQPIIGKGRRRAAVVFALVPDASGQAAVVLTRRADNLRRHSGQFALPGGRVDTGETMIVAGLRELHEEIGLKLPPEAILGQLDDYQTRSGFLITPLVAWAGEVELTPDPSEVAAIYRVPLADIGRPGALVDTTYFPGDPIPALHLESVGTYVFSPTAALLHQFAEIAVHGRRTAVAHMPQPAFAAR